MLRLLDVWQTHPTDQTRRAVRDTRRGAPERAARPLWFDFNFAGREWRFIASKTKQPHIVPRSHQALTILDAQRVGWHVSAVLGVLQAFLRRKTRFWLVWLPSRSHNFVAIHERYDA